MNKFKYKIDRIHLIIKYGFLWRKPDYLLKAFKNAFLHRLRLKKTFTLRSLCLAITYACNYRCPYCFTREMMHKRKIEGYLQLVDYRRIANQAMAMGAISFAFQGGEIWLRKDFKEIIKAFDPQKHYIAVTTNGSFIDQDTIQELNDLGVDTIFFSIESGIAEEHDAIVGLAGSYQRIMQAMETVLKSRIRIGINIVLSKQNIYSAGFYKLVEFSNKHRLLLNIIFARALGGWKGKSDLTLSEEDVEYFNRKFRPFYPYLSRDINFNYSGKRGCPAAKESFYINPWGDMLACPFNHTSFGNVKKELLADIQKRAIKISWFDHFHPKCLTAEEKDFIGDYYLGLNENGLVDYSYWYGKDKNV